MQAIAFFFLLANTNSYLYVYVYIYVNTYIYIYIYIYIYRQIPYWLTHIFSYSYETISFLSINHNFFTRKKKWYSHNTIIFHKTCFTAWNVHFILTFLLYLSYLEVITFFKILGLKTGFSNANHFLPKFPRVSLN